MIRGGDELLEHACQRLGIEPGETTADGTLTVEFAECLGICDYAPCALADDGRFFGPLDEATVDTMLDELKKGPVASAPTTPVLCPPKVSDSSQIDRSARPTAATANQPEAR